MALKTTRIDSVIDGERMKRARVAGIGLGGSADLLMNLTRSGLGAVTLIDPDTVSEVNMVRQNYLPIDIGQPKSISLAGYLKEINPDLRVTPLSYDITAMPDELLELHFRDVDLIISTTDSFAAQAKTNEIALRFGKPAVWPGIYEGGKGGEVVFWHPGLPCYRCLLPGRYRAQSKAREEGRSLDPKSDGTTIWDDGYIDCIAGMIAIGLLTRGAPNRFGRLIEQLGDRNFIRVKIDPGYSLNGRDIVREELGIPASVDTFFAWNAAARRDPSGGADYCPDCERYQNLKAPAHSDPFEGSTIHSVRHAGV